MWDYRFRFSIRWVDLGEVLWPYGHYSAAIALPIWLKLAWSARTERQSGQTSAVVHAPLPVKNRRAWVLTLFFGLMAAIFYSLTAWLAPAIQSHGYSQETAGNIQTLFTLISLPSTLFIPMLVHRYQKRVFWLVGCAMLELIGVLMLNLSVSPWLSCDSARDWCRWTVPDCTYVAD
ncbi:hypothetical protein Q0F98_11605 [Paenibacillus amylolyticus]|nr:hypothetical protein Q0F98_11605 [Paenibacillus amylolyticus]